LIKTRNLVVKCCKKVSIYVHIYAVKLLHNGIILIVRSALLLRFVLSVMRSARHIASREKLYEPAMNTLRNTKNR